MSYLFFVLFSSLGVYILFILFFLIGLRKLKSVPNKITDWPHVAVVVAARNEEQNLTNLLQDFSQLDYPTDKLDIVIVDDRSSDNTWSIIEHYSKQYRQIRGIQIRNMATKMTPKKYALTQAIEQSNSEYILSTDADCRIPPGWVKSMVSHLESGSGIVIGASAIESLNHSSFSHYQMIDFLALVSANAGASGWGFSWTGSGQNLAYKRSAFEKINGFYPVKDRVSGDDMYLVQAISKTHKCTFNSDAGSFIKARPVRSIIQFLNQRIRWSSNSRLAVKTDWFFLLFLFNAFLLNTAILSGSFVPGIQSHIPMVFGIKFVCDALVIFSGASMLHMFVPSIIFIIWSMLQPIYIPFIGISGLLGKFIWKA
ncbi:MAG: glycosyltransferase [Candidatus Marinimicrobia bacterium]|nr:glycosyltransferase [Candidatus Neomarinimicrobiota bacterium]